VNEYSLFGEMRKTVGKKYQQTKKSEYYRSKQENSVNTGVERGEICKKLRESGEA
jgi:hypothetical protein